MLANDTPQNDERRTTKRYAHRACATLSTTTHSYPSHLLNISKSGALLAVLTPHELTASNNVQLSIEDSAIKIGAVVAHVKKHYIGLKYNSLDKDMMTYVQNIIDEHKHDDTP